MATTPQTDAAPESHLPTWAKVTIAILGVLVPILTLSVAYLAYRIQSLEFDLTVGQDRTQRIELFRGYLESAEKFFCEQQSKGVQIGTKAYVDRAAKLEPQIRADLTPLDYIALSSVGSYFWPHELSHRYATQALDYATKSNDRVAQYAAYLLLGHIEFLQFKKSGETKHLTGGRQNFSRAKDIVTASDSMEDRHLTIQLYLSWYQSELYVGRKDDSDELLKSAKHLVQELPDDRRASVYVLDGLAQHIANGYPPKLPCPSQITMAPVVQQQASIGETQEYILQGKEPTVSDNAVIEKLNGQLEDVVNALSLIGSTLKEQGQQKPENADNGHFNIQDAPPAIITPSTLEPPPTTPLATEPPKPTEELRWIKVVNGTNSPVRISINGGTAGPIPPQTIGRMQVKYGPLTIGQIGKSPLTTWEPRFLFVKSDGSRAIPVFVITSCCAEFQSRE
jgi:hypothetical protein